MVPARPTTGSVGSCAPKLFSMKPKSAPPSATEKSFCMLIAPPLPWPFRWCFFLGAARGAETRMIGCATRGAEYLMICALFVATEPPFFLPHTWGLFLLVHLAMAPSVTGGGYRPQRKSTPTEQLSSRQTS